MVRLVVQCPVRMIMEEQNTHKMEGAQAISTACAQSTHIRKNYSASPTPTQPAMPRMGVCSTRFALVDLRASRTARTASQISQCSHLSESSHNSRTCPKNDRDISDHGPNIARHFDCWRRICKFRDQESRGHYFTSSALSSGHRPLNCHSRPILYSQEPG